jgi:integrase
VVGFSRERPGKGGKTRYAAIYRDIKGHQRSAGTFATERQADKAWQRAEAVIGLGRVSDPSRGRQTFRHYVEETWLPNHEIEATTRQGYTYTLYRHIMPEFGPMRMIDIMPEQVREWITALKATELSPASIAKAKVILSAIFTTALNDQVTFLHPCKGVKTPPVVVKPRTIITPEQFADLYQALPDDDSRLFVETAIESGLRWGELAELRVRDLNFPFRMLTISRAVVEVHPKFHPQGGRFLVKDYPKDREFRRFKLSTQITAKLKTHVADRKLGSDDLLFRMLEDKSSPDIPVVAEPDSLGHTEPNAAGRCYRHGTMTGYSLGRCRCEHCRASYARYRAERRANGKDDPRPGRTLDTDGHIPKNWFRNTIWLPALKAADLQIHVRMHDLRHAHASWLQGRGVASDASFPGRCEHGAVRAAGFRAAA